MYNRYVSQGDGSFQRSWVPDQPPRQQRPPQSAPSKPPQPPQQSCPPPPPPQPPAPPGPGSSPLQFLKQLLPKGFDFGDLAILFLLLLMAGDSKENRDNALLTMALYFIL